MAKVMISMSDEVLARLDAAARAAGKSRSELVRDALRLYLATGRGSDRTDVIRRMRARMRDVSLEKPPEDLIRRERQR